MNSSEYYTNSSFMGSTTKALVAAAIVIIIAYFAYSYYMSSESIQPNPFIGTFDGMTPIPLSGGSAGFLPPNPYWK